MEMAMGSAAPPVEAAEASTQGESLLALAAVPESERGQGWLAEMAELQRFANAGRLVMSVTHSMRNALAVAQANLEFLSDALAAKGDAALAEAATEARAGLDRALSATKQVIGLVRDRAESLGAAHVPEAVNSAVLAIGSKLGGSVRLELDLEPVPPVEIDEGTLQQVLVNLLLNATDAAPESHPQVRVSARRVDGLICIAVADNGPAVPPEQRDRIFQNPASGRVERGGAGLGLSITRALIRAAGGDLIARDGPLGGAEFVLLLSPCG